MSSSFNTFPVLESSASLRGPQFQANRKSWEPLIQNFEAMSKAAMAEGEARHTDRHQSRGQLLERDRISLLLDPDSPFLELCPFAGYGQKDVPPCGNLISVVGSVCGQPCLVLSHIPTQNGGAWSTLTIPKQNRVTEIATKNGLSIIALVQSAGVLLPEQFKIFSAGAEIFRELCRRTQQGQQSCAIVFGSSTAGGAYHPALPDYSIFVKDQAQVFLGGPPLVKMATGEIVDDVRMTPVPQESNLDRLVVEESLRINRAHSAVGRGQTAVLVDSISRLSVDADEAGHQRLIGIGSLM